MGRQIHFYMLPEDRDVFLRFVQNDDESTKLVPEGSDSPLARPFEKEEISSHRKFYLWSRRLLPQLNRKRTPDGRYYGLSVLQLPILEFVGSQLTTWEGKPALVQGRLYGIFDPNLEKPLEFLKWYERLTRWVRKNYRKSPTRMGGYVAASALQLFNNGGYLLPQFLPPRTETWLAEISQQHKTNEILSQRS